MIQEFFIYSWPPSIESLYFLIPTIFGAILSIVIVYNKHRTTLFRVLGSIAGLLYLILSGFGTLLTTQTMKAVGVNIVSNHEILNCILMSLVGAGLFLGVLSNFPSNIQIGGQFSEIKTLGDFIYNALDDYMDREIDRDGRKKLLDFLAKYDPKLVCYPLPNSDDGLSLINKFINFNSFLDKNAKDDLRFRIDGYVSKGDLLRAIFELTDSDKTNITLEELRNYLSINLDSYLKIRDEIHSLLAEYDPKILFYPSPESNDGRGLVSKFIDTNQYIGNEAKNNLKWVMDLSLERGDFVSAIFELIRPGTNITLEGLKNYISENYQMNNK